MPLNPETVKLIQARVNEFKPSELDLSQKNQEIIKSFGRINQGDVSSSAPIVGLKQEYDDFSDVSQGRLDPVYGDLEERRAQDQGSLVRDLYILPRVGTKIISEIAKMPGEIYGLGEWATTGFDVSKFQESVDNQWMQSIDEAYQATNDELLPVYKRRAVEQGGLLKQITSSEFWATEGADGAGFMLAFMAPGAALKLAKLGKGVENLGKMAKIVRGERALKVGGQVEDIAAAGINTVLESGAEGIEAAKATSKDLYNKKYLDGITMGLDPQQAGDQAAKYLNSPEAKQIIGAAGANTTKANLAILLGPNLIDQKWLFKGYNKTAGAAEKIASEGKFAKAMANILEPGEALKNIARYTPKELAKAVGKTAGLGVIKEGFFEEGMQSATSNYYKDMALAKKDKTVWEDMMGIVSDYSENLHEIDRQKSIFLGSIMGSVGGAIGAYKSKTREDKLLFGDPGSNKKGLINLLQNNVVERYKSINDIAARDKDGEIEYKDGKPVIDPLKAKRWGLDVINGQLNKKLIKTYQDLNDQDAFEWAKTVHDFNYMLPFFEQEGGKTLLKEHIKQLADKDAKYIKETLGMEPSDVANIKRDLERKVDLFESIYYDTIAEHKPLNIKVSDENKSAFGEFNQSLLDVKTSNILSQSFNNDRIEDLSRKISELESKRSLTSVEQSNLDKYKVKLEIAKETVDALKSEYKNITTKKELLKWWNETLESRDDDAKSAKDDVVSGAGVVDDLTAADNAEEIDEILENTPDENLDTAIETIEAEAAVEAEDASDKPDLRYIGKPKLFTKEMGDLDSHVRAEFGGQLDAFNEGELSALILSATPEEFVKNYRGLYDLAQTSGAHRRLFDTIQRFYENIGKAKTSSAANKVVVVDAEHEVAEFVEDEITQFYPTDTKSSDTGYTPTEEVVLPSPFVSPSRTAIREYTISKGRVKRVNGVAEKNDIAKQMPIDWEYVNLPQTVAVGSEIYFVVNLDETVGSKKTSYHSGLKGDKFVHGAQILIAQKDSSGKEHIISALPAYQSTNTSEDASKLRTLREQIWAGVKLIERPQRTGMYNSGITSKVTKKYSGMLLTSTAKNNPHEVLNTGEKLIFGIAKEINGKIMIDAGENVDSEYRGLETGESGGVYMLIRGGNGKIIPVRCFTEVLGKFPSLMAQAKDLLLSTTAGNWAVNREALRKIVFIDYNYIAKTDSFELHHKNGSVTTFKKDGLDAILSNKIVQIASSEINRGHQYNDSRNYNLTISKEGRLKTDLMPRKNVVNSNFEFSLDYVLPEKKEYTPKIIVDNALSTISAMEIIQDQIDNSPIVEPTQPKLIENNNLPSEAPIEFEQFEDFERPLNYFKPTTPTKHRRVSKVEFYQKWDAIKETQWFKERFDASLIDVEKYKDGLVNIADTGGIQAWGMFQNAIAYVSGAAQTGTTYHEAFHVIFHLYLTDSQRAHLLKENSKLGTTEEQIEEAIADKFMEYVQSEELSKGGLGKAILDFFKQIYYLIKSGLTRDLSMNQIFYKAQRKGFRNAKFTQTVENMKITRLKIDNMEPYEAQRRAVAISDLMRIALDKFISENPDHSNAPRKDVVSGLQSKSKAGAKFSGIDMLALDARAELIKKYNDPSISPEQKASLANMIRNFIGKDTNGEVVFLPLARKSLLQFAQNEGLRIKLSTKEVLSSVDSTEMDPVNDLYEENTKSEGWQIATENVSHKESLSNEVRKELSYIPKLDDTQPDGIEQDDLGFIVYQDFNTIFSDLQRGLANSIDSIDMMEKMAEIVHDRPYMAPVMDKIQLDSLLRTKFFKGFQLSHVDYVTVRQYKDKTNGSVRYKIFSSNRNGVKNLLIDEWKDNSMDPAFNKILNSDGAVNIAQLNKVVEQWGRLSLQMRARDDYNNRDIKLMANILNHIGITITVEDLTALNKNYTNPYTNKVTTGKSKIDGLKIDLDKIIGKLATGANPFSSTEAESTAIDSISRTIARFRSDLMESSFRNGENKTMYAHQTPTFLSRFIQQFKGRKADAKIDWYQDTAFFRDSPWLNELKEMQSRNEFGFIEIDSINYDNKKDGVRYTSMSPKDFENTTVNMYFNNGDKSYAYYKFPVVSDAPKMPFIKFRRYSTEEVLDKMMDVYRQEIARHTNIKERSKLRGEYISQLINSGKAKTIEEASLLLPDEIKKIKHYDDVKSLKFLLLPFFNEGNPRKVIGAHLSAIAEGVASGNYAKADAVLSTSTTAIKAAIKEWIETNAVQDFSRLSKLEVFGYNAKGVAKHDNRIDNAFGNAEAFHKNYFYNSVLANSQMMALFSGDPAFYKPDKKAPSIYSRTVDYQKRNKQNVSPKTVMDINAIFSLTEEQAKIEGKTQITVSPFYQTIYISDLEIPSPNAEAIFEALKLNGFTDEVAGEIAGAYGHNSDSVVNVTDAQAYITLPRYREIMVGLGNWTPQLQNIYHKALDGKLSGKELLMVMQPIKPFYFGHSKIGNLIVSTQNKNSEYLLLPQLVEKSPELKKLYDHMITNNISSANFTSAVKTGEFGAQPIESIELASVHTLNNEDYGLQQETPEHHLDSRSLIGSQIRMIAMADIDENAKFELYGTPYTKAELLSLYHTIHLQDLEESYDKVAGQFEDNSHIQQLLLGEIIDRNMGEERENAVRLVPRLNKATQLIEKVFNLPLFHPFHAKSNESLMSSAFKNNVTKQKIKGGAFVQVSAFGFDKDLKLNIEDGRLVSAECKLPWWSKKYFEPALDEKGQLDITKIPENLREMIGYRIPTEDKYSMLPLIVTGFLPASAGGAIMLPMEITTISGSDFDIDKMYIMMPEWEPSEDGKSISKVEYDEASLELQSKEARNNAKIDIIRAVLTHSDTFSKIFRPGGFPTLEKLAIDILKLEGKADEMLQMILPSTQAELFNRNMTGKQLIGIFANHNKNHAMLQNTNIELAEGIKFDGKDLKSLHDIKTADGNFISRNVAEWLAAVVDNAKNPLSAFINVNTYTADVAAMMTRVGYPLETVVAFLSQPILKEFTTRYFNSGADRQAETKITSDLHQLMVKAEATNHSKGLTTEAMFTNIKKGELFTDSQAEVLNTFYILKEQATALADLVRATRADTKGAGPTLSDNDKLLRLREDVILNEKLIGVQELFSGEIFPMEKAFTEFGVAKPTEILSKHFPWFKPAWANIKDQITANMKGKQLSVKQLEQINYELLGYVASGFEFFDGHDRADILNNMAAKIQYVKDNYPKEFSENFFLNKLVSKLDENHPTRPRTIGFKNTGSLTELDKQQVRDNWLNLLTDDRFRTFAQDLVKYSFYSAGFQMTSNSFNHLIPVDSYTDSAMTDKNGVTFNEYLDKMMLEAQVESIYGDFIEQFYKNNSDDSSFVPMVDTESFSNITGDVKYLKGKPAYFQVDYRSDTTTRDFIIKIEDKIAKFMPYVSMRENGVTYLYKANRVSPSKAIYTLTNKLGLPNQVLEYVKSGIDKSAIAENNPFNGFTESDVESNVPAPNMRALPEEASNEAEEAEFEEVIESKPTDKYSEITESIRAKVLNELSNDETLGEYLGLNNKAVPVESNFSRQSVEVDQDYLYIFTDNAARTSGSNPLSKDSWYAKKYGADKKFPTMTQAVARGLNNAAPITTMVNDKRVQWSDSQFDSFKKIIDNEIETIKKALSTDRFRGVKFASQMPIGKGQISDMKNAAPKIWNYMNEKLMEIGIDNTGVKPKSTTTQVQEMDVKQLGDILKKICNR